MFMPKYASTTALLKEYCLKKKDIEKKLKSFETFKNLSEKQLFEELAFCIFTPGSKALNGTMAVAELKRKKLLFAGSKDSIAKALRGIVRFHNNKALYLTEARKYLKKRHGFCIRSFLEKGSSADRRERLVVNIKGIGYKEASHFLRNIGFGKDLAILDTHILKNLKRFNMIKNIPVSLGTKQYLELEAKMRQFSKSIDIPLDALDLLFWSHETGFIYK
jgi:N-glycosylase/DNA lyase